MEQPVQIGNKDRSASELVSGCGGKIFSLHILVVQFVRILYITDIRRPNYLIHGHSNQKLCLKDYE